MVILIVLWIGRSANAQCTLSFKSLSDFENDTTAFINYNFSTRAACYAGKTFNTILTDLGIPVKSFLTTSLWYYPDLFNGMYIYIYPYNTVYNRINHSNYSNIIFIRWGGTLSADDFKSYLDSTDPHKWNLQIENYLKDFGIQEVGIVNY